MENDYHYYDKANTPFKKEMSGLYLFTYIKLLSKSAKS